jgi:hypothetical protein
LVAGAVLLREIGCCSITCFLFIICCDAWTLWGEMTTGYYVLSAYTGTALFFFCSSALAVRGMNRGSVGLCAAGAVLAALAPLIDISGIWVIPSFILFYGVAFAIKPQRFLWRDFFLKGKMTLFFFLAGLTLSAAITLYIFRNGGILSPAGSATTAGKLGSNTFYFIVLGVFFSLIAPTNYFGLDRHGLLWLLVWPLVLFASWCGIRVWHLARVRQRLLIAILTLIVIGSSLMVGIGRPQLGFTETFPAKYLCAAEFPMFALLAVIGDVVSKQKANVNWVLGFTIVVYLLVQVQVPRLNLKAGLFMGRPGELVCAIGRRRSLEDLRKRISVAQDSSDGRRIVLPWVSGSTIESVYPTLNSYSLHYYLPFLRFGTLEAILVRRRGMAATANDSAEEVDDVRASLSPVFLKALDKDPVLGRLFSGVVAQPTRQR